MEKKLPEFKPLPELGNVANNYMSAFNVGMNIYEALAYLQGYVQITYNSVNDLIEDWNNFETYVTENIQTIANEKTQEILQGWLDDGTLAETIKQSSVWQEKVDVTGDVMSGDLQFQENTGVYGTLHSGTKVNMISHSYTGTDDYTQIGDDNAQAVIHSENRPVWYDGAQNQDLLVGEDLPPKENLLDNADFKSGIINQRGQTAYTSNNGYTIDRWLIRSNAQPSLTVNSKSVTLNNDSSLIQFVSLELGKTYTFVAMINGELKTLTFQASDSSTGVENSWLISYLDTFNGYYCVGVRNGNGNKEISYLKLEEGSVYTGMPQWDYMKEWNNCRRYYKEVRVTAISINPTNVAQQHYMIPYIGDVPMVKKPTLVNANQEGFIFSWGGSTVSDLSITSYSSTDMDNSTNTPVRIALNTTNNQAILQVILKLDSEIY